MNKTTIDRRKTTFFTDLSNQLVYTQDSLKEFIQDSFSIETFKNQIQLKKENYTLENRIVLARHLKEKYITIENNSKALNQINLLENENSFTVTTGHQLNIFTGPIYIIYKILHIIKLTKELKEKYPNYNFIPVFWMASEDHDFEEIKSTQLFNQKIEWNTPQNGAVGNFKLENWSELLEQFKSFFGNVDSNEILQIIDAYNGKNLSEATFNLIHKLFHNYNLLIIDANNKTLKSLFKSTLIKEITEQFSFKAVQKTNKKLSERNLKSQANSREINLFHLNNNSRIRIESTADNKFKIDENKLLSKEEILDLIESSPEEFSPNVILRPLYQETILPNLCYVGGGGEIAYWLQLKEVFNQAGISFPLIQVRNSIQIIDNGSIKKLKKLNISEIELITQEKNVLKNQLLEVTSNHDLSFSELDEKLMQLISSMKKEVTHIDSNLSSYAEAESTKLLKQIENFKKKLIKTEKDKHDIVLNAIDSLFEKLFPNNGLQERSMNFFNICKKGKVYDFIDELYELISPFEQDLIILTENNNN